jgi:membrane protein required for colicin V production
MNTFDIVVCGIAVVASVIGFNAGFLRSIATIVGYISATPVAIAASAWMTPAHAGNASPDFTQGSIVFFVVFLVGGIVLGALLRTAVDEAVGPARSLPDRLAGSMLGVVRIALVGVTVVLVFDRVIPAGHDPAFLQGSRLRPLLSAAGQHGLKSLPPDVTRYIDQIKAQHT